MMNRNYLFLLLLIVMGCGKKDPAEIIPPAPTVVGLTSPQQNEVCVTGVVISATESNVTFVWSASQNAETYELSYKNLLTGRVGLVSTPNTSTTVNLFRNTPYSWKIIAKSFKTTTVSTSETWKFYNAGVGVTAYAPYPAELLSPLSGTIVTPVAGKISLSWKGEDVDVDIVSYTVYFGTTANPPLYKADVVGSSLADVPVAATTTYYWMVFSKDSKGNTSTSDIGQFKTN